MAYGCDGAGRRVSGTVGTAKTEYWHDATGLSLETGANAATYLRDRGGRLLSTSTGGATHNYGTDRLGSVTALVSTTGKLSNTYSYRPWGEDNGATGTTHNPFQYTGTYLDEATGMYQMGARYYQPGTGRFTQLDPLGGGYVYANCNPANAIDPTGLYTLTVTEPCVEFGIQAASVLINFLPFGSLYESAVRRALLHLLDDLNLFNDVGQAYYNDDVTGIAFDIASAMVGVFPVVGNVLAAVIDSFAAIPALIECVRSQP